MKRVRLAPTPCIAIDVDGTLLVAGAPNLGLIDWCKARKADGYSLVLWSARGGAHARAAAAACGCADLFEAVIGKPGFIVDDQGWAWIKGTHVLRGAADWEEAT